MKIHAVVFLVLIAQALFGPFALASTVTLEGAQVSYSFESDDVGAFGSWGLSASDELQFFPSEFFTSVGSPGVDTNEQGLVVSVTAKPGLLLTRAALRQVGTYYRWGSNAEALAATGVSVTGSFVADSRTTLLSADAPLNQGNTLPAAAATFDWELNRSLNVPASAAMTVSLSNLLFVYSVPPPGQVASAGIRNTLTTISALAVPVDLPSSFFLLGTAILAVMLISPSSARVRQHN